MTVFKDLKEILLSHSNKFSLIKTTENACKYVLSSFEEEDKKVLKKQLNDRFRIEDIKVRFHSQYLNFNNIYREWVVIYTRVNMYILDDNCEDVVGTYTLITDEDGEALDERFIIYGYTQMTLYGDH